MQTGGVFLSYRDLPRSLRLLLFTSACFTLANALSGAFLYIFLWKQEQSLVRLALYNGLQFLMIPLIFTLIRALRPRRIDLYLRTGIFLHALFYAFVLLSGQRSNPYALGILLGTGAGFYWFSLNMLVLHWAKGPWRAPFSSLTGVSSSLANLLAPLFSGFTIARMPAPSGYVLIFSASLLLFAIALIASVRLRCHFLQEKPAPLFRRQHPNWNRVLLGQFFQGIREGVFTFLAAILVYITTRKEVALGEYAAMTSLISSLSFFLTGQMLRWHWYNEAMLIGSFFSTGAIALFLWKINYPVLLAYGVITALFTPLFIVPFGTRVLQVMDEAHQQVSREYIVEREIVLNAGRVLSIASFVAAYTFLRREWIPVYLLIIGGMQMIAAFFLRMVRLNPGGRRLLRAYSPLRKRRGRL